MLISRTLVGVATLALCAGVAACAGGRSADASAAGEPTLTGVVVAVEPGPEATRVTVDVASDAGAPDRVVLLVADTVPVEVERADGTVVGGTAADLAAGARIRAWHTGPAMRSLPPQYTATRVRVPRGG